MANYPTTDTSEAFRFNALSNRDHLQATIAQIRADIQATEDRHRAALVADLAPLEARLADVMSTLFAQERMLAALPQAPATFQADGAAGSDVGSAHSGADTPQLEPLELDADGFLGRDEK